MLNFRCVMHTSFITSIMSMFTLLMITMRVLYLLFFISISVFSQSTDFEKGVYYYEKAEWNTAKPYFLSSQKTNINTIESQEYLGDIAAYTKNWDNALEYYKPLVLQNDLNANYHFK